MLEAREVFEEMLQQWELLGEFSSLWTSVSECVHPVFFALGSLLGQARRIRLSLGCKRDP